MFKKMIVALVAAITFSGVSVSPARALVDPVSIAVGLTIAFTTMVTASQVSQGSDKDQASQGNAEVNQDIKTSKDVTNAEALIDSTAGI